MKGESVNSQRVCVVSLSVCDTEGDKHVGKHIEAEGSLLCVMPDRAEEAEGELSEWLRPLMEVVENYNSPLLIKIPLSWVTANEQRLITLTISHRARHQSTYMSWYITASLSQPFSYSFQLSHVSRVQRASWVCYQPHGGVAANMTLIAT